ncbi:phosphonate metabolism transcriptional regulator PhnF [Roseovarius indicus]|uniref:phosphonate metabolism transcriptional regulator PhnF n=1 Tax=Roseovarius indicus TaxID=540747 RepID=UPI0032EC070A
MTTDTAKRTPIWKSIHDTLLRDISERRYAPGDKLPTEAALARRFGVNRHTVRRALATLAEDGLVHARRGAGVFVAQSHTDYPIGKRVRFHQNLRAAGHLPGKQLLAMETRAADTTEAELLTLTQGDPVHVYEGLSLSDGQPVALFQSVFPAARFPGLPEALTRLRSVTAALADQGLDDYTRAWTRLNAKLATPTQALHLQLREGAPLLRTISLNIDADGKPVEYGRTWFSGDRVTLTVADP